MTCIDNSQFVFIKSFVIALVLQNVELLSLAVVYVANRINAFVVKSELSSLNMLVLLPQESASKRISMFP